jgi:putative membrane protein
MRYIFTTKGLTLLAIFFHLIGLVGIGVLHKEIILKTTPYHLGLMFFLLCISFGKQWKKVYGWMLLILGIGFAVEYAGVHRAFIFGTYNYTHMLGWEWQGVPVMIGCNWVIVVCGAVSLASLLSENIYVNCLTAATIATAYDWTMEPIAIKLNYWHWAGNHVTLFNYVCWWIVSFVMSLLWHLFKNQSNQFAVNLLLVQLLFFAYLQLL